MPQSFAINAGSDPTVNTRLTVLEDNEFKVAYFAEINTDSGMISIPIGAEVLLNQFSGGVDAYVSTVSLGQVTGENPKTVGDVKVDVLTFDIDGNYTLDGVPSSYPVAIVFLLKIKLIDWSNLILSNIIEYEKSSGGTVAATQGEVDAGVVTDKSVTPKTFNDSEQMNFLLVNTFKNLYNY